ncbi:DNA polymerase III subunit delta [Natroniella sulfidigena]|uniref:DNA polymerase III subunit delta n=1 Tax=Natroniella sulfidigena TaxID=723921 RepID=UPI00200A3CDC|nr:DNA polymerase III subunit delta [Natroniella sulfidigena]MCK8816859.1 DNA polymerase III subunit delta [Natroniella sulfidigena]
MDPKQILQKDLNQLAPVYLVYGDNYLIKEFSEQFISTFVNQEMKDFGCDLITETSEDFIYKIINSTQVMPFMSDKRIVVVHTTNLFSKKMDRSESLIELLDDFPKTTRLLFVSFKKPDKRLKLYKKVASIGEALEFKELKYKRLDDWIKNKVRAEGLTISFQAIKLLESTFNNDLQRLDTELEKIITFVGPTSKKEINKQDVAKVISKDQLLKENAIFDFVDAIGKKKNSQALNLLNQIMIDGGSSKQILGMIARQIRLMLQTKSLYRKNLTVKQIARKLNQHPYPIEKCLKQSKNFSMDSLEEGLEELHQTDINLVSKSNPELEMELLVLKLSQLGQ